MLVLVQHLFVYLPAHTSRLDQSVVQIPQHQRLGLAMAGDDFSSENRQHLAN